MHELTPFKPHQTHPSPEPRPQPLRPNPTLAPSLALTTLAPNHTWAPSRLWGERLAEGGGCGGGVLVIGVATGHRHAGC